MNYKYIFGPVPSRRFGYSLGVDIVPLKICTLNCLYCECGKTTTCTTERKDYIKIENIIDELNDYLRNPPSIDVITVTGSGEPTLNSGIGKIINHIKSNYKYKTVLLTNGTLLFDKNVRDEIKLFDIVKISLDAISDEVFRKINLPSKNLNNKIIIDGIIEFRKMYKGEIWIEIFIIPEVNNSKNELSLLKESFDLIKPEKIQLNTVDRPTAFDNVKKASRIELEFIKEFFSPYDVEIIGKFNEKNIDNLIDESMLISMIKRRPLRLSDIEKISNYDKNQLEIVINNLKEKKIIKEKLLDTGKFYYIT